MDNQKIQFNTDCTANTISVDWQRHYIVKHRAKDSKDVFAVDRTSESKIQISNLKNETLYEIKIFVEDTNGDESLLLKTEVRTVASVASELLKSAEKISNKPVIYRLCPFKTVTNLPEAIQIREFFSDVNNKKEQSLLLLGARGSGKSTLVDAFVNYVTDVSFADNFRFKITCERQATSINLRQKDIVCYKLRCKDGFKVAFNLNIIDVPGFQARDNESIYRKLLALFESVRCVDAACLVVPSFCRDTDENRSIFENILSIFRKDIKNVIPIITFDDSGEMHAISSLKAAKVPFKEDIYFRFSNSQLLSGEEGENAWNKRYNQMTSLFGETTVFVNCSLEKTLEVLSSKIKLKQSPKEEKISKDDNLRKRRQLNVQLSVETNLHVPKICINCKMCKQTCVFDCSLSVRFFWYIVILLEKFWSFMCCICSCCQCCSRCRCVCKLPYCYCIKCFQRCLGCTCSCSFAHHDKEYGKYRKSEKDTLKNVSDIECQNDFEIKDNKEKLLEEKRKNRST